MTKYVDLTKKTCTVYQGAVGALLVYDITNSLTFKNLNKWLVELQNHANADIKITMVGNKSDLRPLRAISTEEAKSFAEENQFSFIETSALDAYNVDKAFQNISTEIYQNTCQKQLIEAEQVKRMNIELSETKPKKSKKKCCDN